MTDQQPTPYQLEKQRKREAARQKRLRRIELARVRLYVKQTGKDPYPKPVEGTIIERAGTVYRVGRHGELRKIGPAMMFPGEKEHRQRIEKERQQEEQRDQMIQSRGEE